MVLAAFHAVTGSPTRQQQQGIVMNQADRDAIIERCAIVIDQCNSEGPFQAIAGAARIRALKSEPIENFPCFGRVLNQSCTIDPDRCAVCGFVPAATEGRGQAAESDGGIPHDGALLLPSNAVILR
jgi:hypothetical protein